MVGFYGVHVGKKTYMDAMGFKRKLLYIFSKHQFSMDIRDIRSCFKGLLGCPAGSEESIVIFSDVILVSNHLGNALSLMSLGSINLRYHSLIGSLGK